MDRIIPLNLSVVIDKSKASRFSFDKKPETEMFMDPDAFKDFLNSEFKDHLSGPTRGIVIREYGDKLVGMSRMAIAEDYAEGKLITIAFKVGEKKDPTLNDALILNGDSAEPAYVIPENSKMLKDYYAAVYVKKIEDAEKFIEISGSVFYVERNKYSVKSVLEMLLVKFYHSGTVELEHLVSRKEIERYASQLKQVRFKGKGNPVNIFNVSAEDIGAGELYDAEVEIRVKTRKVDLFKALFKNSKIDTYFVGESKKDVVLQKGKGEQSVRVESGFAEDFVLRIKDEFLLVKEGITQTDFNQAVKSHIERPEITLPV